MTGELVIGKDRHWMHGTGPGRMMRSGGGEEAEQIVVLVRSANKLGN